MNNHLPKGYVSENGQLWLVDEEELGFRASWKVNRLLHHEKTPFQEITVFENDAFGRVLALDGIPQTSSGDGFIYNEMIVHVPLTTHPNPRHVAIIGGGDGGAARETVKYPEVEQVTLVEIDERVVELSRQWLAEVFGRELNPRVKPAYRDGNQWIKEQEGQWDVIIVDSSDPVGPATVLFETPFYEQVYRALKEDGLMVCQSESPFFHAQVLKRITTSLRRLFPIVRTYLATIPTYPGGWWSFTLASKKWDPLTAELGRLQAQDTQYVNPDVFRAAFQLPTFVRRLLEETDG
ncbi:MAG: spermidine synthase [Bacillus thermozeamaize]|uniref:Polyamine aminopropyltransferase n=1 Tax=Bacillus thermozeamaize TaxID=230954 RepID=A0A1Y3Q2J5_9BACI|nr:MAG: spermidine synthase [Bacillus thermozeamaize]